MMCSRACLSDIFSVMNQTKGEDIMAIYCEEAGEHVTYAVCLECEDRNRCRRGRVRKELELRDAVQKLKVSEERHTEAELLQKFRKVYLGLKERIGILAGQILHDAFSEFLYEDKYSEEEVNCLRDIAAKAEKAGRSALFHEKDVETFLFIIETSTLKFREQLGNYYVAHHAM